MNQAVGQFPCQILQDGLAHRRPVEGPTVLVASVRHESAPTDYGIPDGLAGPRARSQP